MTPHTKNCVNMLQWNARSIVANKCNLIKYIQDNVTDIVILQETHIKPKQTFSVRGYNSVQKTRNDGKGGVGFLIAKSISYSKIELVNNFNN